MRVLLVHAHPVPESYSAHLRDVAAAELERNGHVVDVCDLYAEGFDPVLSLEERLGHHDAPETKPHVFAYAERLRNADALVFVYPTWWSGPPAMLKGWWDRAWVEGVAYHLPEGSNRVRGKLRHIRKLVVVTTHGSSRLINVVEGENGKRQIGRTVRVLCHPLTRTHWVALYGIDRATPERLARFDGRVVAAMSRL
jgi:putative NADPH-quinone reductase